MQRTTRLPCGGVVDDRRVQSDNILSLCNKMVPPNILEILFQFRSQRSIIEKSGVSIVDFGRRKDDSSSFAKRNNFFHVGKVLFLGLLLFCRSRGGSLFGRGRRQDTGCSGRNSRQGTTAAERKGLCDILSAEKHHYGGCWKLHWRLLSFWTALLKWISADNVFDTNELSILENMVSLWMCLDRASSNRKIDWTQSVVRYV